MYLKEHYKEDTVRVLCLDNNKELRRSTQKRRVYIDRKGNRFIRSYGHVYLLNQNNEWRQPISHALR